MNLTQAKISYETVARAQKDGGFRDAYAWHKRIWEAFPGRPESERTFLSRLDDTGQGFRLLLLSSEEPTRPAWCPEDGWVTKSIDCSFFEHRRYGFSLLANPTRKLVVRDEQGNRKKNGRREAITKREDLIAWIRRKGEQHGFQIDPDQLKTVPQPRQIFLKKKKSGTHTATEFTGHLEVTDPDAFYRAATQGIGSAKAFGFGMLCLRPFTNP